MVLISNELPLTGDLQPDSHFASKERLSETVIKQYLTTFWKKHYKKLSVILPEVNLCEGLGRIDLLIAADTLYGIEIKSEYDNLGRLEVQLETYNRVVSYLYIACSVRNVKKIRERTPEHIGLIVVGRSEQSEELSHFVDRNALSSSFLDSYYIARLLRKTEVVELLKANGDYKCLILNNRCQLWRLLVNVFEPEQLTSVVAMALRSRYRKRLKL